MVGNRVVSYFTTWSREGGRGEAATLFRAALHLLSRFRSFQRRYPLSTIRRIQGSAGHNKVISSKMHHSQCSHTNAPQSRLCHLYRTLLRAVLAVVVPRSGLKPQAHHQSLTSIPHLIFLQLATPQMLCTGRSQSLGP